MAEDRRDWASKLVADHEAERSLRREAPREDEAVEEATPRLEYTAGQPVDEKVLEADKKLAPSARSAFWASTGDNRYDDRDEAASLEDQRQAFKDYESRPDIESRASILAREQALPGTISTKNVQSGDVLDFREGVPGGKKTKEAKKETENMNKPADEDK